MFFYPSPFWCRDVGGLGGLLAELVDVQASKGLEPRLQRRKR